MFEHFSFEYPYLLLLLVPFFLCLKFCKEKNEKFIFPNATLFKQLGSKKSSMQTLLKVLAFILLTIALASPFRQDDVIIQKDKGYEISLILDASGSMQQMDKFGIVKGIVSDFIKARPHDKLGLTIFADFAYVAIPLTYDKQSIQRLLSKIDVGIAGTQKTALYEALFMSSKLFKDSHAKEKIAILLTDGMDNADTIPLDVAIKTAKKYGIKVYVIGVGGAGDYNPSILRTIAKDTGGEFFGANSIEKLKKIYSVINQLEKSEIKADKYIKKSYFFQYPLGTSLLIMIGYILLRRRR